MAKIVKSPLYGKKNLKNYRILNPEAWSRALKVRFFARFQGFDLDLAIPVLVKKTWIKGARKADPARTSL